MFSQKLGTITSEPKDEKKDDYHVQCAINTAKVLRSDLLAPDADVTCTNTHRADSYMDIPAYDPSLQALQEVGHLLKKIRFH